MQNTDPLRAAVVAAARQWLATPYRHQARVKGRGVDCVGLIIAAGLEAEVMTWSPEAFAPWAGYGRLPNPTKMRAGLETFLRPLAADEVPSVGDVAFFAWRDGMPMHLGILAEDEIVAPGRLTMIHATSQIGSVVEHGFAGEWPGRVDSYWRYPGIPARKGDA